MVLYAEWNFIVWKLYFLNEINKENFTDFFSNINIVLLGLKVLLTVLFAR